MPASGKLKRKKLKNKNNGKTLYYNYCKSVSLKKKVVYSFKDFIHQNIL